MVQKESNSTVSVIMPTYKRHLHFLKRAVDSVLNQSYHNIELVVIDDNGGKALEGYRREVRSFITACQDDRITYLCNEENMGASRSRNKGIEKAKGTYITFLDDDDQYLPDKIMHQISYMKEKGLDVCFSDLIYHNEKEEVVDVRTHPLLQKSFTKETLLAYHLTHHITGTPTFMYQKSVLLKIGGFPDQNIAEEYHLMQKTIEDSYTIGYLHAIDVIAYRHEESGLSTGEDKLKGEGALYAFKKTYFKQLTFRERQFIHFRHYIIVGIVYKRKKKILKSLLYLGYAALLSPWDALNEGVKFIVRLRKYSGGVAR